MVYLIPKELINPTYLWKSFIKHSTTKGGIEQTILDCHLLSIYLHRPKFYTSSKYIYHSNILDFLEQHIDKSSSNFSFECKINICEGGFSPLNLRFNNINPENYDSDEPIIKANVPYISFIYDMKLKRILLIFKDNEIK